MKDFSMFPETRGTGRTTKQLLEAPPGSIYIWVTRQTGYVEQLAAHLGRTDLEFRGPSFLLRDDLVALDRRITIDHAAWRVLSTEEFLRYYAAKQQYEWYIGREE